MKTMILADGHIPSAGRGTGRRAAVWLLGLALAGAALHCTPLFAEVLDDFEDRVKFEQAWTKECLFGTGEQGVTNGHLRLTVTPSGNHGFSNVHYNRRTFRLEPRRTVEFRVDLISVSGDGAIAWLQFGVGEAFYAFGVDSDTIAFVKNVNPPKIFFLTNNVVFKTQNVKLVMTMTCGESEVSIRVRSIDNGSGAVLFDHTPFRDTADQDPLQVGTDQPPASFLGRSGTFDLLLYHDNAGAMDPNVTIGHNEQAEVVFDNAEVLEYDSAWVTGLQTVACLPTWPENTAEEQIVVGASSLASDAVWTPWPEPIFKRFGELCMAVPTTSAQQFLKLLPGTQFIDDFDPLKQPFATRNLWVQYYWEPANANKFTWNTDSGSLRVQCPNSTGSGQVGVMPPGPDVLVRDFYASVDILDWGTGSNQRSVGIVARGFLNRDAPTSSSGYIGELWLNYGSVGKAHLNIFANGDNHGPQFDLEAGVKYRLVFTGTGSQLTLRLFKQDNMELAAASWSLTRSLFSSGPVGLWVGNYGNAAYDFTLDNFFVTGTKP